MRARLSARNEGTQKYFLKTAFYGATKDKYIADQTSSTKPVEAASAVTSSAVGIQLGCNSSSYPIRRSFRWSIDHCGHDPGNVALRPGDIPMSADLARDVGVG